MAVSSMVGVVTGAFQVWVACTCVCLLRSLACESCLETHASGGKLRPEGRPLSKNGHPTAGNPCPYPRRAPARLWLCV